MGGQARLRLRESDRSRGEKFDVTHALTATKHPSLETASRFSDLTRIYMSVYPQFRAVRGLPSETMRWREGGRFRTIHFLSLKLCASS